MDLIIANAEHITFDIENQIDDQVGSVSLPFPGMDRMGTGVCQFFNRGACSRGVVCPFRHIRPNSSVVCKHWLRGLCKKGDECEFLHEYDNSRMPDCFFFSKYGDCGNKDCPFIHAAPEDKVRPCAWYMRGFCRHGSFCFLKHQRGTACPLYMAGFCPLGPECDKGHPKHELPIANAVGGTAEAGETGGHPMRRPVTCFSCGEVGHKNTECPTNPVSAAQSVPSGVRRPIEEVTCFKCQQKGHYANRCPSGLQAQSAIAPFVKSVLTSS